MGFWSSAATYLIRDALTTRFANDHLGNEAEMCRYADFRDGRPDVLRKYFLKRPRENDSRYADRPKLSWPFCRVFVDAHAEALVKDVKVTCQEGTQAAKTWAEISEHNDMDAYWMRIAQTTGTYGASIVRPTIHVERGKPMIEYDCFTPLECKLLYESSGAGSSVKRFVGVAIQTMYSLANGDVFPPNFFAGMPHLQKERSCVMREEFISADRWVVWLDGEVTPVSPFGDLWMPREDEVNPYGFVPAVLFNGLETEEQVMGISDIAHPVYDNQVVNERWSDIVYAHELLVPVPVLKTKDQNLRDAYKLGLGTGWSLMPEEEFAFASANLNFGDYMKPMQSAMEIMFANARVPAVAVGLGRLFGGNIDVSGAAKFYEWKPTVSHAKAKRKPFTRAIKQLVRNTLIMSSVGTIATVQNTRARLGMNRTDVEQDVDINVTYNEEIVPVSQGEMLETMGKECLYGFSAHVTAIAAYKNWDLEKAAREVDLITAEKLQGTSGMSMLDIVAAVDARHKKGVDTEAVAAAEDSLFKTPTMPSDEFGDEEKDDDEK